MNIHEHQAKELLKKYGANVPNGVFALTVKDILEKDKKNTSFPSFQRTLSGQSFFKIIFLIYY